MTRIEENEKVVEEMIRVATNNPTGTYEEMMTLHIGSIAAMLADISKSLAIIAGESESQIKSTEAYVNAIRLQEDKNRVLDNLKKDVSCLHDDAFTRYHILRIIDNYRTESEVEE